MNNYIFLIQDIANELRTMYFPLLPEITVIVGERGEDFAQSPLRYRNQVIEVSPKVIAQRNKFFISAIREELIFTLFCAARNFNPAFANKVLERYEQIRRIYHKLLLRFEFREHRYPLSVRDMKELFCEFEFAYFLY